MHTNYFLATFAALREKVFELFEFFCDYLKIRVNWRPDNSYIRLNMQACFIQVRGFRFSPRFESS